MTQRNIHKKKIKVLIIDDSISMRKFFSSLLSFDHQIEVIATAQDPFEAFKIIEQKKPDVITLDLHMPKMDGFTFLQKMMQQYPTPTIIISSYAKENSENALKALTYGAIDIFPKQVIQPGSNVEVIAKELIHKVKLAARISLKPLLKIESIVTKKQHINPLPRNPINKQAIKLIAIAASTGGTDALRKILSQLPENIPSILIVQHMAKEFLQGFANNLNNVCQFKVKLAEQNETIEPGKAYLAPGDLHMEILRQQHNYIIRLKEGPLIQGVRPSANPLFSSVARNVGKYALGIILTGMGADGSDGLLELKKVGSLTIAQDEETSVVFGMPKKAIAKGAVDLVLPLNTIAEKIILECSDSSQQLVS
ncbi:protein-glutamate methylesterase/protein-glutamine glutaminase [Pigmentibacter ruber]|nr:chemotaxis response regulator protein-glutamate methylesterase [Pigmentibacter ruber]